VHRLKRPARTCCRGGYVKRRYGMGAVFELVPVGQLQATSVIRKMTATRQSEGVARQPSMQGPLINTTSRKSTSTAPRA